jgi:dCTP diphosphatase
MGSRNTTVLETDAPAPLAPPSPVVSLDEIALRLRSFREAREWERFHTPRNLAMSIVVECGELLEHFQWRDDEELGAHLSEHEADVAEELADVAIYLVQLADTIGISLSTAIAGKIDRNDERYPVEQARGRARKPANPATRNGERDP